VHNTNPRETPVVVTGLGMMTGLGLDTASSWEGICAGKSPIRRFTRFDPAGLSCPYGVELPEGADQVFGDLIKTRNRRQMTRGTMISIATAHMALADSKLAESGTDMDRVGVVAGATGTGYAPVSLEPDENRILRNMASAPAAWISLREKIHGPAFVVSTACSSGAYALHAACGLVVSGQCDAVVCGAADSAVNFLDIRGFCSLMALADQQEDVASASRPFDRRRSGFVMGEGGGMMVVESAAHAHTRGARIYARLSLPAVTSEAYNILSPQEGGAGMVRAMSLALNNAGLPAADIDYVNAHGTSTRLNDQYEVQAIKAVFGDHARALAVS